MNTTSSIRQRALLILATTAALALPAAHAQTPAQSSAQTPAQSAAPAAATSAPVAAPAATARLSIRDIYDRASAAGYRDLYEIELDHGRYKVKGYDAQGARAKVYFNASTGAVEDGRKHR